MVVFGDSIESLPIGHISAAFVILWLLRRAAEDMRILTILAHPDPDSFNGALSAALCDGIRAAGHTPDLLDLYSERFDPVLGKSELESMGSGKPLTDVAACQRRIKAANGLAIVFPVWWFGVPAMLKGFIDRVFQEGFAYRFSADGSIKGLLRIKKSLVLCTTGASADQYRRAGFGRPLKKSLDEWGLRMCGIQEVKHVFFYDVVTSGNDVRKRYLSRARHLGRTFFC